MTTIYIDTNIFMNESFFRSAQAQAFLKACSILQISVAVPDIVIDEVLGNFPKKLTATSADCQFASQNAAKSINVRFEEAGKIDLYGAECRLWAALNLGALVLMSYAVSATRTGIC